MKREQKFTTEAKKYLAQKLRMTGAFEMKVATGKRIPFSSLAPHQEKALLLAKHGCLSYKIPDVGYDKKPFDMFILAGTSANVVVRFADSKDREFYIIDIDDWIKARTKPSLTLDECRQLAWHIGVTPL